MIYSKINESRDEVLGCWEMDDREYYIIRFEVLLMLVVVLTIPLRNKIFREELPLALMAIIYGDRFIS